MMLYGLRFETEKYPYLLTQTASNIYDKYFISS